MAAIILSCICYVPMNSQAMFNSELAYNHNYRPIYFGMQSEEGYVDISSVYTIENTKDIWRFNVNVFTSPEDSGVIAETIPVQYIVDKKHGTARVNYGLGWKDVNFKNPNEGDSTSVNAINFCYAYFFGRYFQNNECTYNMGKYYKGQ